MQAQQEISAYADSDTFDPESRMHLEAPELGLRRSILPLCLALGADNRYFACGTTTGLQLFECDFFQHETEGQVEDGVCVVDVLDRPPCACAFVASRAPNTVQFWHHDGGRQHYVVACTSRVLSLKLRQGLLVVALESSVCLYKQEFFMPGMICTGFSLLHEFQTGCNPQGLCAADYQPVLVAYPAPERGQVQLVQFMNDNWDLGLVIRAHVSQIACICLSRDGNLLATASGRGTLVRIFNTNNGTCLRMLRRGLVGAQVCSIAFSRTASKLAVSIDTGTVQIFDIELPSWGLSAKGLHFGWHFRTREETHTIVGFSQHDHLIVLGIKGSYYNCTVHDDGKVVLNAYILFREGKPDPPKFVI